MLLAGRVLVVASRGAKDQEGPESRRFDCITAAQHKRERRHERVSRTAKGKPRLVRGEPSEGKPWQEGVIGSHPAVQTQSPQHQKKLSTWRRFWLGYPLSVFRVLLLIVPVLAVLGITDPALSNAPRYGHEMWKQKLLWHRQCTSTCIAVDGRSNLDTERWSRASPEDIAGWCNPPL